MQLISRRPRKICILRNQIWPPLFKRIVQKKKEKKKEREKEEEEEENKRQSMEFSPLKVKSGNMVTFGPCYLRNMVTF
jgi:hypothetical protein